MCRACMETAPLMGPSCGCAVQLAGQAPGQHLMCIAAACFSGRGLTLAVGWLVLPSPSDPCTKSATLTFARPARLVLTPSATGTWMA